MATTKMRLGALTAALVAINAAWSGDARAQDKSAQAALLARDADDLMAQGKTNEACDKYYDSQVLDPRGSTVLSLALCREKQGRIGSAYVLFDEAERVANEEKRSDRVNTAKSHKNALYLKLARLTVNVAPDVVVPGMEIRVGVASDPRGLNVIPQSEWNKPVPVDVGDVKVVVTAPGKATWEQAISVKSGSKGAISVPALQAGSGPPPTLQPPLPTPGPGPTGPGPAPGPYPQPSKPRPPGGYKHEGGRVVIDAQALVGAHLSLISQAPLAEINGTQYIYKGTEQSEVLASCGNTVAVPGAGDCDAKYNPQFGFLGGAQLFLGYAINDKIQFGGRFFGGAHFPVGFMVLGGPSISFQVAGPLWLGVSALVGTTQIEATVTGGKGSIPEANRPDNADESQIDIPLEDLAGRSGDKAFNEGGGVAPSFAGFEVGGTFEISIVLVDNPTDDAGSGALLLSAWPTGMWAPQHGAMIALPIGLGYRFY